MSEALERAARESRSLFVPGTPEKYPKAELRGFTILEAEAVLAELATAYRTSLARLSNIEGARAILWQEGDHDGTPLIVLAESRMAELAELRAAVSSEVLERVEEIRYVLDDVSGAAVASDTRVHLARAALDALLAEVARLEQEQGDETVRGDTQFERAERAEAALAVAREREQRATDAIREMLDLSTGWAAPMDERERCERITAIGTAALVDEPAAATGTPAATLAEPEGIHGSAVTAGAAPPGSASAAADEPGETPA